MPEVRSKMTLPVPPAEPEDVVRKADLDNLIANADNAPTQNSAELVKSGGVWSWFGAALSTLSTTAKTVIGAINELFTNKQDKIQASTNGYLATHSGTEGVFGTPRNPASFVGPPGPPGPAGGIVYRTLVINHTFSQVLYTLQNASERIMICNTTGYTVNITLRDPAYDNGNITTGMYILTTPNGISTNTFSNYGNTDLVTSFALEGGQNAIIDYANIFWAV